MVLIAIKTGVVPIIETIYKAFVTFVLFVVKKSIIKCGYPILNRPGAGPAK
jgi:tetrahydromethanopterin S-methyltransferase subunit C